MVALTQVSTTHWELNAANHSCYQKRFLFPTYIPPHDLLWPLEFRTPTSVVSSLLLNPNSELRDELTESKECFLESYPCATDDLSHVQ